MSTPPLFKPSRRLLPGVLLTLLFLVFALAGCAGVRQEEKTSSVATSLATAVPSETPTTGASAASSTKPSASSSPKPSASPKPSTSAAPRPSAPAASPAASASGATASAALEQTLKDVVQRANDAQQQAFAANDPTPMRATATDSYYAELAQTNQDLADNGVTAIDLLKLEWGTIASQGANSAQVTTYETWQTTYSDGSNDQSRDHNVYTLVQSGGAWKIQSDDHPDAPLGQPGGGGSGSGGGTGGGGTSPFPVAPSDPGQSSNWSGYIATGGTFTAVSGTWIVPEVTAGTTSSADATWVGIGGEHTRDLIQAGTQATVSSGRVRYSAWVEMLPEASEPVPLTVSAGDQVSVAISQQDDGTWLIAFQNQTTGKKYQVTETYDSTLSSAEWIEEAPSSGRRVVTLDDFGTVQFTAGSAVEDGKTVTIAQAGGTSVTMIDNRGRAIATPSALGKDGSSFSVVREAVPTTPSRPSTSVPSVVTGQAPLPGRVSVANAATSWQAAA